MTQFSFTTTTTTHFSSLLLSDFLLFCSFILSHPLYFSYFIFFLPYLLKLLSFLSPLFITTSLFLLTFLTIHSNSYPKHIDSKVGFLHTSYQTVLNTLSWSLDDETVHQFHLFEELEACMVVLEIDTQSSVTFSDLDKEFEASNVDEKEVEFTQIKSVETENLQKLSHSHPSELISKSQVGENLLTKQSLSNVEEHKENHEEFGSPTLGSCGSMRKEKEWKRTLACKLYEERQNIDGSEGMDILWETYEADSGKVKNNTNKKKEKVKKEKKREMEYHEEDEEDVKLCCLQAFKLSTGKMNLGMGRPNLVRISKALKGIGWFQHVSKHGNKKGVK